MTEKKDITQRIEELNPDTMNWDDANAYAALGVGEPDEGEGGVVLNTSDTPPADGGATPAVPPAAPAAPAQAEAAAPTPPASSPPSAPAPSEPATPKGVATADGQHIIPYAVLQDTRTRLREAESELAQAKERLEAAEKKGAGNSELASRAAENPALLTAEEWEQLEADYPLPAKALRLQHERNEALQAQLQARAPAPAATGAPQPSTAPNPQDIDAQWDDAIAGNANISKWMGSKGPEWDEAVKQHQLLMSDEKNADLPFAEQFKLVERMVCAKFDLPFAPAAPAAAAPASGAASTPPAAPKLPEPARGALPSLSDMGGSTPRSGEDDINATSSTDLLARTDRMSEAELMRMAGVTY